MRGDDDGLERRRRGLFEQAEAVLPLQVQVEEEQIDGADAQQLDGRAQRRRDVDRRLGDDVTHHALQAPRDDRLVFHDGDVHAGTSISARQVAPKRP
jgi:hypothetical protein